MTSQLKNEDLYARAGIEDVAEFYRTRHVSNELLAARYFDPLNRFDIRWARTMWVYHNVRRASSVLDVGCGAGLLSLLKHKSVTLTGVDLSDNCASVARRNGYDATYVAQLDALPFADQSFDYVVSLDVMGHIAFAEKDAVLGEIRRVLKPDGVTMHGIECMNRERRKDYDEMSEEELRRFVSIDGHVGMEAEAEIAARFRKFFAHIELEPRYAICQSSDELIKQADEYGALLCDPDFLDYLRGLSFKERRAFNMAMGYVFGVISDYGIRMPKSEYVFLKASNAPLGSFYNEHRERDDLLSPWSKALIPSAENEMSDNQSICLDRSSRARFDSGWYEAEVLPPVARWMGRRARIKFAVVSLSELRLDLTTHLPHLDAHPLGLEFFLNGERVLMLSLFRYGWLELKMDVSDQALRVRNATNKVFEFEIRADRTFQPRPNATQEDRDDRELSIAVCNIEIFP